MIALWPVVAFVVIDSLFNIAFGLAGVTPTRARGCIDVLSGVVGLAFALRAAYELHRLTKERA